MNCVLMFCGNQNEWKNFEINWVVSRGMARVRIAGLITKQNNKLKDNKHLGHQRHKGEIDTLTCNTPSSKRRRIWYCRSLVFVLEKLVGGCILLFLFVCCLDCVADFFNVELHFMHLTFQSVFELKMFDYVA